MEIDEVARAVALGFGGPIIRRRPLGGAHGVSGDSSEYDATKHGCSKRPMACHDPQNLYLALGGPDFICRL
jgi:hypothetical protein